MTYFLDAVRVTSDGYLWMPSDREQQMRPPLLVGAEALWSALHPHIRDGFRAGNPSHVARPDIQDLRRVAGLMQVAENAIQSILTMKCPEEKAKDNKDKETQQKRNRTFRNQRIPTLTRQLEALWKQPDLPQSDDDQDSLANAQLRTIRTLNSIRAIFPLLLPILKHNRLNDKELTIPMPVEKDKPPGVYSLETPSSNDKANNKRGKASKSWFLGEFVFEIVYKKRCTNLLQDMQRVVTDLFPDETVTVIMENTVNWEALLAKFVQDHKTKLSVPMPGRIVELQHDSKRILSIAKECDEDCLKAFLQKNRASESSGSLYMTAVYELFKSLDGQIRSRFPGAELRVYGSCLSDLSLGMSSDVDFSLMLPRHFDAKRNFESGKLTPASYEKVLRRLCYDVRGTLEHAKSRCFVDMECITSARVPVVKGKFLAAGNPFTPDGSINFDICFLNEIAVANSALLSEYTAVDERVKSLLLAIKGWAHDLGINSAANRTLSSYGWVNLGIFYLQCIGFVPNLQCQDLMIKHRFFPDPIGNPMHCIDALNTAFLPWEIVRDANIWSRPKELDTTPVTLLLYGFFHFYTFAFPRSLFAVSIREGRVRLPKATFSKCNLVHFCIEDPFETHDSHCPHDLGKPAGENGQHQIISLLADAESHLRCVLKGQVVGADAQLWKQPAESVVPIKQPKQVERKGQQKQKAIQQPQWMPKDTAGLSNRNFQFMQPRHLQTQATATGERPTVRVSSDGKFHLCNGADVQLSNILDSLLTDDSNGQGGKPAQPKQGTEKGIDKGAKPQLTERQNQNLQSSRQPKWTPQVGVTSDGKQGATQKETRQHQHHSRQPRPSEMDQPPPYNRYAPPNGMHQYQPQKDNRQQHPNDGRKHQPPQRNGQPQPRKKRQQSQAQRNSHINQANLNSLQDAQRAPHSNPVCVIQLDPFCTDHDT